MSEPVIYKGRGSAEMRDDYIDFIKSETRYARLAQSFPERADQLFHKAADYAAAKFERLQKMGKLYE